tara:strand:+ start:379 stop:1047 length:669 start_codon:yes stop_codon:yes gene_type:complete
MNFTNQSNNNRLRTSTRTRIYSNNQVYNNAFILHFESINNLSNLINESNNLLIDYNARNNNNNNSYFSNNNSSLPNNISSNMNNISSNNSNNFSSNNRNNFSMSNNPLEEVENNISYLFRFDTLFPNGINTTRELSYNIITINNENKELLDISNDNIDIFNILDYSNIENPLNDICPITRDRFYLDQNVYMIKNCKHIFNKSALNIWISNNNTCPTCRTNIR